MAGAIESIEKVKLGEIDQWISIRSNNLKNPLLLYLHGGPGLPVLPLFRYFQYPLEDYFIVVQWEQRGAGKSYSRAIPKSTMNIEQFISDLHVLVELLLKRFNKKKIYLIGHSWGSIFGIQTVQKYPDLFYAYIGIGQASNTVETEKRMYKFAVQKARAHHNKKALKQLSQIGYPFKGLNPPYKLFYKGGLIAKMIVYGWVVRFGGIIYKFQNFRSIIKGIFKYLPHLKPEYSILDLFNIIKGNIFSARALMEEIIQVDLLKQVPKVEVPVYFLIGRHDYNWSAELAKKYFDELSAPKKEFIWFEHSAHAPNGEEAKKFNKIVIEKILPETYQIN